MSGITSIALGISYYYSFSSSSYYCYYKLLNNL